MRVQLSVLILLFKLKIIIVVSTTSKKAVKLCKQKKSNVDGNEEKVLSNYVVCVIG